MVKYNIFLLLICLGFINPVAGQHTVFTHDFAPSDDYVKPVEKPYRDGVCLNGSWSFFPLYQAGKLSREELMNPAIPENPVWESIPLKVPSPWNVNSFAKGNGGDFITYPSYPQKWESVRAGWLMRKIPSPMSAYARTLHVALTGNDSNEGTLTAPLRTIQHAADLAQPGDTVEVHEGVYREYVNPPRGGISDSKRIVYEAAPGEKVVIKGSEVIRNWTRVRGNIWKTVIANDFFHDFNPYSDLIHGDWFDPGHRVYHTGAVYLNGRWLMEASSKNELIGSSGIEQLWFGNVDCDSTTIWANFGGMNPNDNEIEINVRRSVFYPERTGANFITVNGFTMEGAATPWAPPTAQQIGLIGTNWSKGWIIENCLIRYSICAGVTLGKYGDKWDNTSSNTVGGYVKTIDRALRNGWSKKNIGGHIVRNNVISDCGQAGIVGSMGGAFSVICNNMIHDVHFIQTFGGAEMAGIKLHGAVDVQIIHNQIYRTCMGIWLDWMAQGTQVSRNFLHDNTGPDLFLEVDHGPFIIDDNLFLSSHSLLDRSQGGAYVHNLFAGAVDMLGYDDRQTPYLKAHSTEIAGFHDNPIGDDRIVNNIFVGPSNLSIYDHVGLPVEFDGNVYLEGAKLSGSEKSNAIVEDSDRTLNLVVTDTGSFLKMSFERRWLEERKRKLITTEYLGKTSISDLPFEQPDGKAISISKDYFGKKRDESNPSPGPFEARESGPLTLRVW
jgi:alpha-N-arabinofuranosidase